MAGNQVSGAPAARPSGGAAAFSTRQYASLLVLAAVLGVPLAVMAWGFLEVESHIQSAVYTDLPRGLGFHGVPPWWPLLPLGVAGVLVAATIRYLPGTAGHRPAEGFKAGGGVFAPPELPGILIAALASIGLGAVVGPEAPLIALGGGVAAMSVGLLRRGAAAGPAGQAAGAVGSFAAISTLLGSPLSGAFLLMEASGLAGAALDLILLPGLLAAGIGSLMFIGMDSWVGLPMTSLTVPDLPPTRQPDFAEFGWALAIGVAAALLGHAVRSCALFLQARVAPHALVLTPVAGLLVAGLAIAYAEGTGKPASDVLFSGQAELGPLISQSAHYTVNATVLLVTCKCLAYALSLSAFRGGPIFPALFIGTAGGIALSHLPGLSFIPAIAMGIGAMSDAMLALPLTSVLLATLLLGKDGTIVMPLVIVAVVVCHVVSRTFLTPKSNSHAETRAARAEDR
jgi:H+/Cl- antiporter ClcA